MPSSERRLVRPVLQARLPIISHSFLDSAFLALKHAPAAMLKTDAASGKLAGGGSIVLTGSSTYSDLPRNTPQRIEFTSRRTAAGLRAGLAPMQCTSSKNLVH